MTQFRNFFISYNRADEQWAEWIAWALADAGYTHYFQKWDFRPGGNFVLDMQKAAETSERTLLVLTPNYLQSLYTQPEWAAAFARDPTGEKRLIVPVRVEICEPAGMLKSIVYCDLVGLDKKNARARLIAALPPSGKMGNRRVVVDLPPSGKIGNPRIVVERCISSWGGQPVKSLKGPNSLGNLTWMGQALNSVRVAAKELQSIVVTSGITFQAQARLRDDLCARIETRLGVTKHHEYEELFDLYFPQLQPDELRLHRIVRAYTEAILHEYNTRAFQLLERAPDLGDVLPSVPALKQHLIIWLKKFDSVFLKTPSMCLLYVGVEEDMGFPSQINRELEAYLCTSSNKQHDLPWSLEERGDLEIYSSTSSTKLHELLNLKERLGFRELVLSLSNLETRLRVLSQMESRNDYPGLRKNVGMRKRKKKTD